MARSIIRFASIRDVVSSACAVDLKISNSFLRVDRRKADILSTSTPSNLRAIVLTGNCLRFVSAIVPLVLWRMSGFTNQLSRWRRSSYLGSCFCRMTACRPNRSMDLVAFCVRLMIIQYHISLRASAGKSRALTPIGA